MGASAAETDDAETRSAPICSLTTVQKSGRGEQVTWQVIALGGRGLPAPNRGLLLFTAFTINQHRLLVHHIGFS